LTEERDPLAFLQERDEKGRFTSTKEVEAPTPEPAPKPETPEPPKAVEPPPPAPIEPAPVTPAPAPASSTAAPPGYVPLAAQLDEREKRQALQRELDDMRRKFDEATKKPTDLDPITDPDGFKSHFESQIAATRFEERANFSELMATEKYGAEAIAAAKQWLTEELKKNPGLWQSVQSSPHPYDFVVKAHKRDKQMQSLGDRDLDAWFEEQAKARGYVLQGAPASPAPVAALTPATPTPLPKPSLASAPAAGGNAPKVPTGPGVAFDSVFK